MNKKPISPEWARERALFLYRSALERGDFETIAAILKQAERDPILDRLIADLDELDDAPLARPEQQAGRPPRSDKYITQHVTVNVASPNGQTPKSDHSQEENDMMTFNLETFVPERPKTLYPFAMRFITLAAAILIVALLGGLLIEMVNDPMGGYPAIQALQTEAPKCAADSVTDATAESVRLGEAAIALLETRATDRTAEMIEQATLLATCALQTAQTPEADAALLRALRLSESLPNVYGWEAIFSPDGRYVLTTADFVTMRLWDVATGEQIRQFVGHPDANGNLTFAFSPDGRTIFSTGGDHTARLWDVETGEQIRQFEGEGEGEVTGRWESATFSPDGKYVLAGMYTFTVAESHGVLMWNVQTGEEVRRFVGGHNSLIFSVGVSPDSRYLATTSYDTSLRLWDMETGDEIRQFPSYSSWTYGTVFSPDGQFLLSGGGGAYARLLNVETGEMVREFNPDVVGELAGRVDYSPDGRFMVTGGRTAKVILWDVETGKQLRVFDALAGQLDSVAFSPDGKYVLTATDDIVTRLWPTTIENTIALACSKLTRDFTADERAEYGLGDGATCS